MGRYDPSKIEKKWQKYWENSGTYKNYGREKKFYALDMFPYPSGAGLHVGHPKGYIATDVVSRFKMLSGYSVLHPMGWDAFGLPAENYAIKNKVHPKIAVAENIATFKKQLELFGFTYDWDREINTTDPEYYRWTQWIFLKMFEKGLAYESEEPVNWCPKCKTVLANEDLENGKCERCGSEVIQRKLRQWVLRMTKYADRLLYDLDSADLDWEELIKEQQRNWIGRSEGAEFTMKIYPVKSDEVGTKQFNRVKDSDEKIEVYTTRLDTVFGMTYAVVAPEHLIISKLRDRIENYEEVEKYMIQAQSKTELERTELQKEKTGVEIKGIKIVNPFNGEEIPLYVADYVLGFYGTGAVMAVPAHDERDFEFAKKYGLLIKEVISPLIIKEDGADGIKEGLPLKERDAVVCVIKHWSENKYLGIQWKKNNWQGFVIGGIEQGESPDSAGIREIREETGYQNVEFIKPLGGPVHSKFYQAVKEENRFAHFRPLLFELKDGEQTDIDDFEKSLHNIVWLSPEEFGSFVNREDMKIIWDRAIGKECYKEDGLLTESQNYSGMTSEKARQEMTKWLETEKIGKKKVNYKMRDWVFSRQRYWGEPIPIVHCEKCGAVAVPEKDLPVRLPEVESYEPTDTGESPLAKISDWVNTACPKCGGPGKRETNTMPQWAGSCWYYLRYINNKNDDALVDMEKEKEWMPVDLYVGGAEHATRHLLYARFWHKFLYDIGAVSTEEPFKKLVHVGLIQAEDGRKMSKRWGNVVNPDDVIGKFGADAMRVYEMFMGPFNQNIAWNTNGVTGTYRFLEKVWKLGSKFSEDNATDNKLKSLIHKTIKKVAGDIENFRFNTAVSTLMILANAFEKEKIINAKDFQCFLLLLSPFAPHISEELWSGLGHKESIFLESWPEYDPKLARDEEVELVIQVNGKVRDKMVVSADIEEEDAKKIATESEKVRTFIAGKEIKKIIYIKGRLVSIVV